MLVSPAEPARLRTLGIVSPVPEEMGADYILECPTATVVVQRKEISDFLASRSDGRLGKEAQQLQEADIRFLVIEGALTWSTGGWAMHRFQEISQNQYWGLLLALMVEYGIYIVQTNSMDQTAAWLRHANEWVGKSTHRGLAPTATKSSIRAAQLAMLMAVPRVGTKTAGAILDRFGRPPLDLGCGIGELLAVPGVGPSVLVGIQEVLKAQ